MKLSKNLWLVILMGSVLVIIIAILLFFSNPDGITQPIAFNHKKHRDNNVNCEVCHRFYNSGKIAGIPPVTVCVTCHEDVIYISPEKAKLQKYVNQGKAVPWQQVYQAPAHVFFSHRLHVKKGDIACETCHGNVWESEQPVTQQQIPLKMKFCIDCHQTVDSIDNPNECIRCHR